MRNAPTTMLAYFAGLMDGEGCIDISRRMAKNSVNPSFRLTVIIANNVTVPLEAAKRVWGGALHASARAQYYGYQWRLSGNDASAFLADVLPYLMIKDDEARHAIAFQERINAPRGATLTQDEVDTRQTMKDELSRLHRARYRANRI